MGQQRTQREMIKWSTTQQEEQDKGHNARQSSGGQYNKRREQMMQGNWVVEDMTRGRGWRISGSVVGMLVKKQDVETK
jgi:hypothetical protein